MRQRIKSLLGNKPLLLIAVLYSCLVTVLFLIPIGGFPKVGFTGTDKIVHILIHIILMISWLLYFYVKDGHRLQKRRVIIILAIIFLYGIIIELCQHLFTVSREADLLDLLANLTGAVLGIFFFKKLRSIFNF